MNKIIIIAFISALLAVIALGYPEEYGPFPSNKKPKPFPLQECVELKSFNDGNEVTWVYAKDTNAVDKVVISQSENDFQYVVKLQTASGKEIFPETKIDGSPMCGLTVYYGFLNEDKHVDYVIETWSGGCGLAAYYSYLSFFLSSEDNYHMVCATTLDSDPNDFVDLNKDGRAEWIHTAFIYGEEGKDNKPHNYWVHNLLQFKKNQIVSANYLDSRFPSWIWYTFKPNHKNTTQLTGEQKKRMWAQQAKGLFPNSETLAKEQMR